MLKIQWKKCKVCGKNKKYVMFRGNKEYVVCKNNCERK